MLSSQVLTRQPTKRTMPQPSRSLKRSRSATDAETKTEDPDSTKDTTTGTSLSSTGANITKTTGTDASATRSNTTTVTSTNTDTTDASTTPCAKRRATAPAGPEPKDDKIDPVEKLLSMTCSSPDILLMDDETSEPLESSSAQYPNLTSNFTKAINDNLRTYYSRLCRSPMEMHNDHSSFSVLTAKPVVQEPPPVAPAPVPFFRAVNFGASPSRDINDYISYDEDEPSCTESEHEDLPASTTVQVPDLPTGKMSFRYRHDNVNLRLSDVPAELEPQDIFKFLNKRAVISGRASEMIGTSSLMIKDFFF